MSQQDLVIANQSFPNFRSDLNANLQALGSLMSGASAPSTTYAYMWWADTTNGVLKQRNAGDSAWVIRATLSDDVVIAKTSAYTIALGDYEKTVQCNASSAGFTVGLPASSSAGEGFAVTIIKTDSTTNLVTIDANGSETIDGALTFVLREQWSSVTLICDGSNWNAVYSRRSMTGGINTIASATTTDIGSLGTNLVAISGTTTITGLGSSASLFNPMYFVRFTDALLLTRNATSLILPGGASITTAAGDAMIAEYLGSGNWRVHSYMPALGYVRTDKANTFTKPQAGAYTTLTDAATVAVDLSQGNNYSVTLGGNRALGNPTNATNGQSGIIQIIQDGTGNRTLSFGSSWLFAGGVDPVLSTGAGALDVLAYTISSGGYALCTFIKGLA